MPVSLIQEKVPVVSSLIEFDASRGEEVFLTVTHGRENGPGIQRTGRSSPFMEHLNPECPGEIMSHPDSLRLRSWLIQEALRGKDLEIGSSALAAAREKNANPDVIRTLQDYIDETPRLAAHDSEFANVYSDYEIIGQQGCGDLTMNQWNVAYINSPLALDDRPVLVFLRSEPLAQRTYASLVKWKSLSRGHARVSIEDLKFFANAATPDGMVWVRRQGRWVQCGNQIEFAVSGKQVLRADSVVDIARRTHQYSDLRHLLQMPNLNPDAPLETDSGRPRSYFGGITHDDIWLGEAQLIADPNLQRAAMFGPVFLSRLYEGLGASMSQVRGAAAAARYVEVKEPWQDLQEGEFRFAPEDETRVEVFFRRSRYGWSMIGLNDDSHKMLCLACEGDPRVGRGYALGDAARKLLIAGARNALLIDEGADVFQAALLEGCGPMAMVAGGGPPLTVTVPLKRTRLRATFMFARAKSGSTEGTAGGSNAEF